MSNTNDFRDREQGKMGNGYTANEMPSSDSKLFGNAKKLKETAEGWDSKSFDEKLFHSGGVSGNDYCYPDEYNDDSGPAWTSHSAGRK